MGRLFFYLLVGSFKPLFWLLPRRIAFWAVWRISGILAFLISHSPLKKEVARNCQRIYKLTNADELADRLIRKTSRYLLEILNLGYLTDRLIPQLIDSQDLDKLKQVLAAGQGAILLFMHCGNWELLSATLCRLNLPIYPIAKNQAGDFFVEFINNNRIKNKGRVLNTEEDNFFRQVLTALKQKEALFWAADTGATESRRHVFLEFFGNRVPVASAWATLALKSGAPVMPIFLKTKPGEFKHQIELCGPLYPKNYKTEEELISASLPLFENFLRQNPDEWFMPLSTSETQKTFGQ